MNPDFLFFACYLLGFVSGILAVAFWFLGRGYR